MSPLDSPQVTEVDHDDNLSKMGEYLPQDEEIGEHLGELAEIYHPAVVQLQNTQKYQKTRYELTEEETLIEDLSYSMRAGRQDA